MNTIAVDSESVFVFDNHDIAVTPYGPLADESSMSLLSSSCILPGSSLVDYRS